MVVELLRHVGATQVFVLAWSMGGPIGLALAEQLGRGVSGLDHVRLAGSLELRVACMLYSEPNIDGGDCFGSRKVVAAAEEAVLSGMELAKAAKIATCRHLVAESDSGVLLRRMQALHNGADGGTRGGLPSLVLIGENNRGKLTSEAALLTAGFPMQYIASSGHCQHADNPEHFYRVAERFFSEGA